MRLKERVGSCSGTEDRGEEQMGSQGRAGAGVSRGRKGAARGERAMVLGSASSQHDELEKLKEAINACDNRIEYLMNLGREQVGEEGRLRKGEFPSLVPRSNVAQ